MVAVICYDVLRSDFMMQPSCALSLAFCAFSDFALCSVVKVGWRSRILPLAIISFENANASEFSSSTIAHSFNRLPRLRKTDKKITSRQHRNLSNLCSGSQKFINYSSLLHLKRNYFAQFGFIFLSHPDVSTYSDQHHLKQLLAPISLNF
ncbi:hypothetical protein T4B_5241 [Trichinella pseudospiralis]|uniref:Uncharacterized protein n=1 Tax=Trichinella pseudospiralis TaxID=6337 RepID=A0A0V1E514_TRIPS|nr:hypothetical protein T4A_8870 [Trichinella pseudospiralis]KRZ27198.1 hypothetical protein T4B_5241 [Trichinella pseudospiralis]